MRHSLKSNEKLHSGVNRIAGKEAAVLRKHLAAKRLRRGSESVHKARTTIKRMRSLLRLVREKVGDKFYHKQNSHLRAIGQSLSPVRDPQARLKTLQKLRRHSRRRIFGGEFLRMQTVFAVERDHAVTRLADSKKARKTELHYVTRCAGNWPVRHLKKHHLRSGLKRAVRRFLRAHETAQSSPTDQRLHEWRKRTKDLYYQFSIIESIGPNSLEELIDGLKQLGEILGNDHDLAMLEPQLVRHHWHFRNLRDEIHARRKQLQQTARETVAQITPNLALRYLKLKPA